MHKHSLGTLDATGNGRQVGVQHLKEKGVLVVVVKEPLETFEYDLEASWNDGATWEKVWTGETVDRSGMLVGSKGEVLAYTHVRLVVTAAPLAPAAGSGVSGSVQGWLGA